MYWKVRLFQALNDDFFLGLQVKIRSGWYFS